MRATGRMANFVLVGRGLCWPHSKDAAVPAPYLNAVSSALLARDFRIHAGVSKHAIRRNPFVTENTFEIHPDALA
ncbi:hypothetical protein BVI434_480006 [Burkholderia vietnamiensis]|nr:hypothetical protein BVI434_480006 [Burkholderia vietnamiensis]